MPAPSIFWNDNSDKYRPGRTVSTVAMFRYKIRLSTSRCVAILKHAAFKYGFIKMCQLKVVNNSSSVLPQIFSAEISCISLQQCWFSLLVEWLLHWHISGLLVAKDYSCHKESSPWLQVQYPWKFWFPTDSRTLSAFQWKPCDSDHIVHFYFFSRDASSRKRLETALLSTVYRP